AVLRRTCVVIVFVLTACGKSGKLVPLLPDAPTGWSAEGQPQNHDVHGVGYSSMKSYVSAGSTTGSKGQRVQVQILAFEEGANKDDVRKMYLGGDHAGLWESTTVNGFDAADSFDFTGQSYYSRVVYPNKTTLVQIIAFFGEGDPNTGLDKMDEGKKIVQVFSDKMDFKQIAALK
ncbi:MAG: hypothetical protein WBP90_18070, partial [Terracidiphilus sp.]